MAEFITAKILLFVNLATFPIQPPREIILQKTLASLRTRYSEGCDESIRKDKLSNRDQILPWPRRDFEKSSDF